MNNKAIAVKCSHRGPQIVRQCQSPSYTYICSNFCRPWERMGVFITSHIKLFTNARRPVSVKKLQELLEDEYEDFESLDKVEKSSYVLGSELWEMDYILYILYFWDKYNYSIILINLMHLDRTIQ